MSGFWKDRNVFVTGCTGLLGSHLTRMLLNRGANVVGLVRDIVPKSYLWESRQEIVSDSFSFGLTIVRGAVEDYQVIERTLNEYEIDTVFHLAAQTIVRISNRNPLSTFESNIKGTWNLLEACRRISCVKQIVIASSDKAYGDQIVLPYDEKTPLQGTHPYDVSKSCADLLANAYSVSYGLPVCISRCGNLYGPGDLNFNRLIPETARFLLNNQAPVIRSDGSYVRDYIYVKDAVLAYLLLAEKMTDKTIHGQAFNFSNETPITVLELVKKIMSIMDKEKLEPTIQNVAINEIKKQYLSSEKARNLIGWSPKYSLEHGLKETIQWYTEFFSKRQGK